MYGPNPELKMNVECTLCGHSAPFLKDHLQTEHGLSLAEYQAEHPDAPIASDAIHSHMVLNELLDGAGTQRHPPGPNDLTVKIAGTTMKVHGSVPASACLKDPWKYKVPEHGDLAADVAEAALMLTTGMPSWIHGPPGSGKDAFLQHWSAVTRTPSLFLQINPKTNLQAWFFRRSFNSDGSTGYEEGKVLRALRDGYRCPDGTVIPYALVFSDFDRADPRQMEAIRACIESTGGRVAGPMGEFYEVLEGTQIFFTANSSGTGDEFGRRITSNPVDSAFMDRVCGLQFHWMDWDDEEPVLRDKFPEFARRAGHYFEKVGKVTKAIREKVDQEEVNIEFSHRALEKWLRHAEKILEHSGGSGLPPKLLNRSARVGFLDLLPDRSTREQVRAIMQPHIKDSE